MEGTGKGIVLKMTKVTGKHLCVPMLHYLIEVLKVSAKKMKRSNHIEFKENALFQAECKTSFLRWKVELITTSSANDRTTSRKLSNITATIRNVTSRLTSHQRWAFDVATGRRSKIATSMREKTNLVPNWRRDSRWQRLFSHQVPKARTWSHR